MSFGSENGYEAIKFAASGVNGARAVAGYLLRFSMTYDLPPWNPKWGAVPTVFRNFQSRAELGPDRLRLGYPQPDKPLVLFPHQYPQDGGTSFDLILPTSSIEKLEEHRGSGGLEIVLLLSAERMAQQHATVDVDVRFRIGQSEWIDVLKQMKYGNYLLCEIPIELGDDGDLREAWSAMAQARDLLYSGHYRNVVVECRKALEAVVNRFELQASIKSAVEKNRQSHRSMSKRERFLNLIEAARRATHLGAHPDDNNQVIDYSRREALLIYVVIAAAIAEISERPENSHEDDKQHNDGQGD